MTKKKLKLDPLSDLEPSMSTHPPQNLHCANCNVLLDKENEISHLTIEQAIVGQEKQLTICSAMSIVFERERKMYPDFLQSEDENKLFMCICCSSIFTNMYNAYTKFMLLTGSNSYVQNFLKESILWKETKFGDIFLHSQSKGRNGINKINVQFEKIKSENSTNESALEPHVITNPNLAEVTNNFILPVEPVEEEEAPATDLIADVDCDDSAQHEDILSTTFLEKFPKLSIPKLTIEDINSARNWGSFLEKRLKYSTSTAITNKAFVEATTCSKCERIFIEPRLTKIHIESAHKNITKVYCCQLCEQKFANKWFCSHHVETVHFGIEIKFKCSICDTNFKSQALLNHHRATVHQDRLQPFRCNHCQEGFDKIEKLRNHLTDRHPNSDEAKAAEENTRLINEGYGKDQKNTTKISCSICKRIFTDEVKRDKHIRYDHEKRTACVFCSEVFTSTSDCRRHERRHESQKCKFCDKSFPDGQALVVHQEESHSETDPFVCEMCGKTYFLQRYLNVHYKWHEEITAPPKYNCTICKKSFALLHSYKSHKESYHGAGRRKYRCKLCPRTFYALSRLNGHEENVHGKVCEFKCEKCGRGFGSSKSLLQHKARIHRKMAFRPKSLREGEFDIMACYNDEEDAFFCSICNARLGRKDHFIRHVKTQHGTAKLVSTDATKIFKCGTCIKVFEDEVDLHKHIKLKGHRIVSEKAYVNLAEDFYETFECDECGVILKSKYKYNRHKLIHHPHYDPKLQKVVEPASDDDS